MNIVAVALQVILVLAFAPVVVGLTRRVRAFAEGRRGGGVLQTWRDLRKLLRKQDVDPLGTTVVFRYAPAVLLGSAGLIAAVVPVLTTASPLDGAVDLFAVVGLLLLGTVATALAGIDTGTAFGGMGASREMTIAALVEPTILLAVFSLSIPGGSANLGAIVANMDANPARDTTLAGILAFVALVIVIIAETGRLPVDNPSTHLELTMVHEAMILEYAGPRLAMVEWASATRLTALLAMLANLYLPWGISGPHPTPAALALAAGVVIAKVAVLAAILALGEVFVAKLRLFRVPELLAGSFLLALLAVTAANFFQGKATA